MTMMKYYLYISDAKVNMLLPQVPAGLARQIAVELKLDLKIISGSLRTEHNSLSERVSRTQFVSKYIEETQAVGNLEEPSAWIHDVCEARMGHFEENPDLMVIAGSARRTAFLLAGSTNNLIGHQQGEKISLGYSFLPRILDSLKFTLGLQYLGERQVEASLGGAEPGNYWFSVIQAAHRSLVMPVQRFEFLAKRLLVRWDDNEHLLLGTPLYVALLD